MRPRQWAVGIGRMAVMAAVVAVAAVVMVTLGMIVCVHIVGFSCFMKRRTYGPTNERTDGPTDRPSYRDARTHLKMP